MITLHTNHSLAVDSPDHLYPLGARQDNSTSKAFIDEVESYFDTMPLSVLDLGCAGGQLVADLNAAGHEAYGIDGSDYGIMHGTANWPGLYGKSLFTADLSKPLRITDDHGGMKRFDLVTAWEVIEHFRPGELLQFFDNVTRHVKFNGLFVGTINTLRSDCGEHGAYHQSVFPESEWLNRILPQVLIGTGFALAPYPFRSAVRNEEGSFRIAIARE